MSPLGSFQTHGLPIPKHTSVHYGEEVWEEDAEPFSREGAGEEERGRGSTQKPVRRMAELQAPRWKK